MIPLKLRNVDRENNYTPIISNKEIDEYAEAVLADYKPKLLRKPGIIDHENFLESYLGMNVILHHIYSEDSEHPILAVTAFKDIEIPVFDEENECVSDVYIPARSVVLNNIIAEAEEMQPVARFSGMHEAGHSMMQWHVFTGQTFDGEEFDPDYDWDDIYPAVCCRRENIESKVYLKKERNAKQWREHHADYFAGAITMPNITFMKFVRNLMRSHGYYKDAITMGVDEDWDILAYDILPDAINEAYGVSKQAARIKLKTSRFVNGVLQIQ
ncbi:MAG: hypothetical protein FWF15_01985 [Oscillospiraceae bacterium]|nr:hypothetical protein [Oscillospiraceae bacterium]